MFTISSQFPSLFGSGLHLSIYLLSFFFFCIKSYKNIRVLKTLEREREREKRVRMRDKRKEGGERERERETTSQDSLTFLIVQFISKRFFCFDVHYNNKRGHAAKPRLFLFIIIFYFILLFFFFSSSFELVKLCLD